MPGRPHKPTAIKRAQGTLRPTRETGREPAYEPAAPEKPATVAARPAASAEWDLIVPLLSAQRVLTKADRLAVTGYCLLAADLEALERTKQAADWSPIVHDVSVDGAGVEHVRPRAHPVLGQSVRTLNELRHYLVQLGLTPSSRSKVASEGPASSAAAGGEPSAFEAYKARRKTLGQHG